MALLLLPVVLLGATWNVLEDGTGDAPTINAAMDSATAGDTVLVWPGDYHIVLDSFRIKADVHLVSQGGPSVTTMSGESTTFPALTGSGSTTSSLLDGFTFQGIGPLYGSVGVVHLVGDHEIRNCVFDGLGISNSTAALYLRGENYVHDCVFQGVYGANTAWLNTTGIRYEGTDELTVADCRFEGNHGSDHLGVWVRSGHATIRDCEFVGLHDGGIAIDVTHAAQGVTVENCLFDGGDGPWDGIRTVVGVSEIVGNTFVDVPGRAVRAGGAGLTLDRNVIAGSVVGGRIATANPVITCNVLWNNATHWELVPDPSGVGGNVVADPLFCDAGNHVFTVSAGSPCLPENSNGCGLIGAYGQGCGAISVESLSWGGIKSLYR
jgi:hypothetical protein